MDDTFIDLVANAVKEGLELVKIATREKKYNECYTNWVSYYYNDKGFPSFSQNYFNKGPIDYTKLFVNSGFGINDKPLFPQEDIASFQCLLDYVKVHPEIQNRLWCKRYGGKQLNEKVYQDLLHSSVFEIPVSIISRYIHLYDSCDFNCEKFIAILNEVTATMFDKMIYFDIYVPICFVHFDLEQFQLMHGVEIVKMCSDFQIARASIKYYGTSTHDTVLGSATHALVLRNYQVDCYDINDLSQFFSSSDIYPLEKIDEVMAIVRLVTGFDIGYSQLIIQPHGWAYNFKAHLPPLLGTTIKAYPNFFEKYYWLTDKFPCITTDIANQIGSYLIKYAAITENKVSIALKRFNSCYLRDDNDDFILDVTIAFEALLNDNDKQEMTHKLAMRVAALSKLYSFDHKKSPIQVAKDIKKIYTARSKIVHGNKSEDKHKVITNNDGVNIPITIIAMDYLKMILKILIEHERFRCPSKIDEYMLTGN